MNKETEKLHEKNALTHLSARHDICQKNYATAVLEARILRKKRINRNTSQLTVNTLKRPNSRQKSVNHIFCVKVAHNFT